MFYGPSGAFNGVFVGWSEFWGNKTIETKLVLVKLPLIYKDCASTFLVPISKNNGEMFAPFGGKKYKNQKLSWLTMGVGRKCVSLIENVTKQENFLTTFVVTLSLSLSEKQFDRKTVVGFLVPFSHCVHKLRKMNLHKNDHKKAPIKECN